MNAVKACLRAGVKSRQTVFAGAVLSGVQHNWPVVCAIALKLKAKIRRVLISVCLLHAGHDIHYQRASMTVERETDCAGDASNTQYRAGAGL